MGGRKRGSSSMGHPGSDDSKRAKTSGNGQNGIRTGNFYQNLTDNEFIPSSNSHRPAPITIIDRNINIDDITKLAEIKNPVNAKHMTIGRKNLPGKR